MNTGRVGAGGGGGAQLHIILDLFNMESTPVDIVLFLQPEK